MFQVILLHCPELSNVSMRMSKGEKAPYEDWEKILGDEKKKWKELQDSYEKALKDLSVSVHISK